MKLTSDYIEHATNLPADIRTGDLPDIDLYMDQVITLLGRGKDKEAVKVTKTMINNYRKMNIIKPLKGKKYSPEHIVQLLLILQLKNLLTIGEIERMLPALYNTEGGDVSLKNSYDTFLNQVPQILQQVRQSMQNLLPEQQQGSQALLSLLILSRMQEYIAAVATNIVNDQFPSSEKEKK